MRLGKRTAKIVHEAIVLAHVEGARWAGVTNPGSYPKDSDVVRRVLGAAANLRDLYPTLGRLEEAVEADRQQREASLERIWALMDSAVSSEEGKEEGK